MTTATLSETTTAVCLFCIVLVPLVAAGLALVNTGLGRSRSAAHAMLASLCVLAVAGLAYLICGFSFEGLAGGHGYALSFGAKTWSWIGNEPWWFRRLVFDGSSASLVACLQMFSVGVAALIPLGAGAERWRLGPSCVSAAILAGWTYPLFAHWVWGGGWLAQLGVNYGLGKGFLDAGGSSSIQAVGGLTALSIAWILGPRARKYSGGQVLSAIPGHNAVYVLLGCMIALVGWFGLNSAGAILFAGASPGQLPLTVVNTAMVALSAGLTAAIVTRIRFKRPDASITANGWIGGLVASSAGCAFYKPAEAVLVGMVAGGLVTFAVEFLEFQVKVDDPSGAISAHGLAGLWGTLAVGWFAQFPGAPSGQFLAQFAGVATLIGFVLPLTYGLNWMLNRFYPQRVSAEGEQQGMDLHELGADAYPEFVTHTEEYLR